MKITIAQARAILPNFKRAVEALQEAWDEERNIESFLGKTFDGMDEALAEYAIGNVEDLTIEAVQAYIEGLEAEE